MVVVGLIGILMIVAVPAILNARRGAMIDKAESDLEYLAAAIRQLVWDTGKWPLMQDRTEVGDFEVWDLTSPNAGLISDNGIFPKWQGPYISRVLLDPWGSPYFFDPDYRLDNKWQVVVGSFGPNRRGRNVYDSDNIYIVLK